LVEKILRAAMSAPSARNEQPWHFVVIRERSTLLEIPKFHPYSAMLVEASLAILVCGDPTLEAHPGQWVEGCSAATQNILLAAHALGLGAVWLGVHPRPQRIEPMRKMLDIPEEVIPFALVSIGYPAEQKPRAERFKPERVHYERW